MSELQKALDGYVDANNQLIEAKRNLRKQGVVAPVFFEKVIHVCDCSDELWEDIVSLCGSEVKLVERGDSDYPYQQEVMYGDYTIFRLLEVKPNE